MMSRREVLAALGTLAVAGNTGEAQEVQEKKKPKKKLPKAVRFKNAKPGETLWKYYVKLNAPVVEKYEIKEHVKENDQHWILVYWERWEYVSDEGMVCQALGRDVFMNAEHNIASHTPREAFDIYLYRHQIKGEECINVFEEKQP